jgi:hypothetical protein
MKVDKTLIAVLLLVAVVAVLDIFLYYLIFKK